MVTSIEATKLLAKISLLQAAKKEGITPHVRRIPNLPQNVDAGDQKWLEKFLCEYLVADYREIRSRFEGDVKFDVTKRWKLQCQLLGFWDGKFRIHHYFDGAAQPEVASTLDSYLPKTADLENVVTFSKERNFVNALHLSPNQRLTNVESASEIYFAPGSVDKAFRSGLLKTKSQKKLDEYWLA